MLRNNIAEEADGSLSILRSLDIDLLVKGPNNIYFENIYVLTIKYSEGSDSSNINPELIIICIYLWEGLEYWVY